MGDEIKLCKNCANYKHDSAVFFTVAVSCELCYAEETMSSQDVVTGKRWAVDPRESRRDESMCGMGARYFVSKSDHGKDCMKTEG